MFRKKRPFVKCFESTAELNTFIEVNNISEIEPPVVTLDGGKWVYTVLFWIYK